MDVATDFVLDALGKHEALRERLAFKGARILTRYLQDGGRASMDLDATLLAPIQDTTDRHEHASAISRELKRAIERHVDDQPVVQFYLVDVKVVPKPRQREHHRGWNAFEVVVRLSDRSGRQLHGPSPVKIDIVAPEGLQAGALDQLPIGTGFVRSYSLPLLAGEKLRALLSSLPPHLLKMGSAPRAVRAKDVCDIARIVKKVDFDEAFWTVAAGHFRHACQERLVDCCGPSAFLDHRSAIAAAYRSDVGLEANIPFEDAWPAFERALVTVSTHCQFPWRFPL